MSSLPFFPASKGCGLAGSSPFFSNVATSGSFFPAPEDFVFARFVSLLCDPTDFGSCSSLTPVLLTPDTAALSTATVEFVFGDFFALFDFPPPLDGFLAGFLSLSSVATAVGSLTVGMASAVWFSLTLGGSASWDPKWLASQI